MPLRLNKKFWFIAIVVFTIGVFLIGNMESQSHVPEKGSSLVLLSEDTFINKIESEEGPMCVLFYMPHSPYYSEMERNLVQFKDTEYGNIPMFKLNVEEYPEPFFNQNLPGTPVVIFYEGGEETARVMGNVSARNIKHILKRLI